MSETGRRLNHVELVHRPGERDLAIRTLGLLGFTPKDRGGTFVSAFVDPHTEDFTNNVVYVSEVVPEQWRLEQALLDAMGDRDGDLATATFEWTERLRREPQRSFHFGVRYPDRDTLDGVLAGIREAGTDAPDLAGRIGVSGVFAPGDPGAYADTMVQAFVHTDVVASGLLVFGQHVELQLQL